MKKKIMILLLCAIIVAGGGGCEVGKKMESKDALLMAMNEKYNETFRFIEWDYQEMGSRNRTAHVECNSFPDRKIRVEQSEDEKNNLVYLDNYMFYNYESEIEEKLLNISKKVFPKSVAFFYPEYTMFHNDIGLDTSLEQMLEQYHIMLSADIVILEETKRKESSQDKQEFQVLMEQWRQEMENEQLQIEGEIYIVRNSKTFGEFEDKKTGKDNLRKWKEKKNWYEQRCVFAMDSAYEFLYMDWR